MNLTREDLDLLAGKAGDVDAFIAVSIISQGYEKKDAVADGKMHVVHIV